MRTHAFDAGTASRERLETLARLLDDAFRIPGTRIRVGLDAALNLIPGVGTLFAKALSAYLILEAARAGAPRGLVLRMVGNVGIDAVVSAVPIVGWVADVFVRANARNMTLLRRHLDASASASAAPVIEGTAVRVG
jgi:hypothetical protein